MDTAVSLYNNTNYNNNPKHYSIYCSKMVEEKDGDMSSIKVAA